MKKRGKVKKRICLILILILSTIICFSSTGMKPVKAAEQEIGRNGIDIYGGTMGEIITMELISYDDSRDVGTYRFRYYLYHHGDSYTYQAVAVGLYLDGNHKATFSSKLGKDYSFSNDQRLFGTADIQVSAGKTHHVRLQDVAEGGLTSVSVDKDIYIPYPSYTVTYKDYNGQTLKTQSVQKYSNASPPSNPSRTGYTFTGWSSSSSNITGNKTITAQYQINNYTVRYLDHDNTVLKTQLVPYGSSATPPVTPKRTGYTFIAWSNNGTGITANRDIKAEYKINNYTISFNSMGGSTIASQSIPYQGKVSVPAQPTRVNYKFMGWYTDLLYKTSYDFNSPVGATDFALYAKWDAFPVLNTQDKITIHDYEYTFDAWQQLKKKDVSASDREDGNLTDNIIITKDTINLNVPGNYKVNYKITDSVGNVTNREIPVNVIYNNPPELSCSSYKFYEDEITNEKWKDTYLWKSVKAVDKEDGDLTDKVEIISDPVDASIPGIYEVKYKVMDQYHKTTTTTAKVEIKYNYAPLITGGDKRFMENEYTHEEWKDHILDGIEANDVEDGNITNKIKILDDDVDFNKPGFYHVKYEVIDGYGKKDIKNIQVEVVFNVPSLIIAENKRYFENELDKEKWKREILKNISAIDTEDGDVTDKIKIVKDTVKLDTAGSYEVIYSVTDSGGKTTYKTIDVTIKNNHKPTLEIFAENKRFVEGEYTMDDWINKIRLENVSASDIEDHDLTKKIEIIEDNVKPDTAGEYTVTYKVTDQYNKCTQKSIRVVVEENLPPVIYASEKWFSYDDNITDKDLLKDVIAYDDIDGEITKEILIKDNTINYGHEGDYTVTYIVTDSLGKSTTLVNPIHIKNNGNKPTPPPIDPPAKPSDENSVIMANSKKFGEVELTKIMEESSLIDIPYDSVIFGIYTAEDICLNDTVILPEDSLVNIIKLDNNHKGYGHVYQSGYYYVQEISVDGQYSLSDTKYYFRFDY